MALRYFRYVRKSEDDKRKQVISIPAQLAETDRLIEYRRLNVVETFVEERTASLPGRPIFASMMERLRRGEAEGIICWKVNRLARNPIDAGDLIWQLGEGVLQEVVACDRTYGRTANDKFMMYLDFGLANQYVDNLSEDVRRGNRQMLESGLWPGRPPLGYMRDPRYRDDPNFKEIIPDPERFEYVRQMWRLLLSGVSLAEIRDTATNQWGLTMPRRRGRGGGPISKAHFYRLFRNRFYAGLMVRSGMTLPGKHRPMVTMSEFERAQRMIDEQVRPRRTALAPQFPYRGLVRCGKCGSSATAKLTRNAQGRTYKHYYCYRKDYRALYCPEGAVREEQLEEALIAYFSSVQLPERYIDQVVRYIERLQTSADAARASAQLRDERRLQAIEEELSRLRRLLREGTFTKEEYEADKDELLLERAALLEEKADAKSALELFRRTVAWLDIATKTFVSGEPEEKQRLARRLLLELRVTGKKVVVLAKKPFAVLCERPLSLLSSTLEDVLGTFAEDDPEGP